MVNQKKEKLDTYFWIFNGYFAENIEICFEDLHFEVTTLWQEDLATIEWALIQFTPPANFSVINRQILKIGKTGTRGFLAMRIPNFISVFRFWNV